MRPSRKLTLNSSTHQSHVARSGMRGTQYGQTRSLVILIHVYIIHCEHGRLVQAINVKLDLRVNTYTSISLFIARISARSLVRDLVSYYPLYISIYIHTIYFFRFIVIRNERPFSLLFFFFLKRTLLRIVRIIGL